MVSYPPGCVGCCKHLTSFNLHHSSETSGTVPLTYVTQSKLAASQLGSEAGSSVLSPTLHSLPGISSLSCSWGMTAAPASTVISGALLWTAIPQATSYPRMPVASALPDLNPMPNVSIQPLSEAGSTPPLPTRLGSSLPPAHLLLGYFAFTLTGISPGSRSHQHPLSSPSHLASHCPWGANQALLDSSLATATAPLSCPAIQTPPCLPLAS